jgi:MFS family permease
MSDQNQTPKKSTLESILKEMFDPFVDLVKSPRVIWGINIGYTIEGLCYFGILTYLAMHFSDFIFQNVEHADVCSHNMVMIQTAGIAISMVLLGFIPDKIGVRWGLIISFALMLVGRVFISGAPTLFGFTPTGQVWSLLNLVTVGGILVVVVGYGIYQPAAYAAVRQFTNPKTAPMAYAMLYALMNAGSSLAMMAFFFRDEKFLGLGIPGTFWIFTALTAVSLLVTYGLLSKKAVSAAIERAKLETASINAEKTAEKKEEHKAAAIDPNAPAKIPLTLWITMIACLIAAYFRLDGTPRLVVCIGLVLIPLFIAVLPKEKRTNTIRWMAAHPLGNTKFFFFIFALIPVQTLFTYNWLILPQYIERAYQGWIGQYFEICANLNPILIFLLVPTITAITAKRKTYNMMIWGTLVMGSSAFILSLGATPTTLFAYLIVMTVGEAMWSARFLQLATEIAPEGKAGQYQGVAQLPWFLTKFLVPLLYSGRMMEKYCPAAGEQNTQFMWLIFGFIAVSTPVMLILAKKWIGQSLETKKA